MPPAGWRWLGIAHGSPGSSVPSSSQYSWQTQLWRLDKVMCICFECSVLETIEIFSELLIFLKNWLADNPGDLQLTRNTVTLKSKCKDFTIDEIKVERGESLVGGTGFGHSEGTQPGSLKSQSRTLISGTIPPSHEDGIVF